MLSESLKVQSYELLSHKAYRILKEAIVRGEIKPYSKLTLKEIATYMGISETPIREAINYLASEGLVKLVPHKGIIINEISLADFQEMLQIRSVLEGLIAELAATNINDEEIHTIMEIICDMELSVNEDNRLVYNDLDIRFHDLLVNIAGNRKLKDFYNNLISQSQQFRLLTLKLDYRMPKSLDEHRSIASALQERDPLKANTESQKHINSILTSLAELRKIEDSKQLEKKDNP